MPNVRDHDASVYLRLQGDALSVGGYEANPVFWEEVRDEGSGEGLGLSEEKRRPSGFPLQGQTHFSLMPKDLGTWADPGPGLVQGL